MPGLNIGLTDLLFLQQVLLFGRMYAGGGQRGEVMFFWDGKNKKMTKSAKRAFFLMKSCYNCSLRAFVWRVEYE